jgi:hypothetical protein
MRLNRPIIQQALRKPPKLNRKLPILRLGLSDLLGKMQTVP